MIKTFLLSLTAILAFSAQAQRVIESSLPQSISPSARYVFYSHGYIVEGNNATPQHPRWGVYDFPAVKQALSSEDHVLVAAHRKKDTPPFEYANELASQVNTLIENGVPASNIYLVGFSRGGFITAITSSLLKNDALNFVILAACTSGLAKHPDVVLHGRVLSIYETSDSVGSCNEVVSRSGTNVVSFKELAISTGKEHGAFYRPIEVWVSPVMKWIQNPN
jgi:predicted esterase